MRNARLGKLWDALHSSYWFLPSVMVVTAIALIAIHTQNHKYQAALQCQVEMIRRVPVKSYRSSKIEKM